MRALVITCFAIVLRSVRCGIPEPKQTAALSCPTEKPVALILDVDNTLYCERQVKFLAGTGIEEQIVANTHAFCQRHLNLTPEQADDLYRTCGSTIEGIRQTYPEQQGLMEQFYREVYDPIDVSSLLAAQRSHTDDTGYSHSGDSLSSLRDSLMSLPYPIYLASNSPSWHVNKVLAALGLSKVPWAGLITPDLVTHDETLPFPTKAHPHVFFRDLIDSERKLILLDDSKLNVERARDIGMDAILVTHADDCTVEQALATAVGHVAMQFNDINYLKAKNVVDAQSIHAPTWNQVAQHLVVPADRILRVVDVGAGLLSMLRLLLQGQHDKRPLLDIMEKDAVKGIEYYAYEPNAALLSGCKENLAQMGFQLLEESPLQCIFHRVNQNVTVYLRLMDFTNDDRKNDLPPQLIVGCCFADLMDPHRLVQSLLRFIGPSEDTIVYFPITFAGITQFLPPHPFGSRVGSRRVIPSDTAAFDMYANALSNQHGHNLDPDKLVDAMGDYGATLLHRGPSNWKIDPEEHEYLWDIMLYFFGTVGASEMMKQGWDSIGWIDRAKQDHPRIEVSNVDLLFRLPRESSSTTDVVAFVKESEDDAAESLIEEIQFTAPYEVGTVSKTSPALLGPNQVEVCSVCSLISSGTELKIFKGLFDDAALDVNIDGMAEERMAYPLAYGYSLVGRVTRCGSDVDDPKDLLGRLVFTFSPHSSRVIVDRNALQVVPDGIDAEDAIFMPSVETALSMVHDAHVRVGEKVAVFGQGLIGLLVTAILSKNALYGTVTAFDGIPERLAASAGMGSSEALLPAEVSLAGPFDVSIEVSGNSRALQSAIDNTRSGGRIIVGSWYGNADVKLKLGIDFHRSHKTIKTSQVSEIPAELTALWSKERRFALTWELVKLIRPSRLITRRTTLAHAKAAYESLDQGKEIAVSFSYPKQ